MRPKPPKGTSTYNPATITHYPRRLGEKIYEIHDHLGNVRTSFLDIKEPRNLLLAKIDYSYKLHTLTAVNYFPYGAERDGQSYQAPEYNFGFNAMLRDDEVRGDGRSYSTLFREYDPLLGRWGSVDPLMMRFADISPYASMGCNPIRFVDILGLAQDDPNNFVGPLPLPNEHGFMEFEGTFFYKVNGKWSNFGAPGNAVIYGAKPDPNSVNPLTLNTNLWWTNYTGPYDPETIEGQKDFTLPPSNQSDVPAKRHDEMYMNIHKHTGIETGALGFLLDTRVIGADYQFTWEEFQVANNLHVNPLVRVQAALDGLFIGVFALPKTIFQLSKPFPQNIIEIWYYYQLGKTEPNGNKVDNKPYEKNKGGKNENK